MQSRINRKKITPKHNIVIVIKTKNNQRPKKIAEEEQ